MIPTHSQDLFFRPFFWHCVLLFLISINSLFCQQQYIQGRVIDEATGEHLIGASIYDTKSGRGVISNPYGYFNISVPQNDAVTLTVSFLGYKSRDITVYQPDTNKPLIVSLSTLQVDLEEVELVAEQYIPINERNEIGTVQLKATQIENLPALGGEVDLFKTLQLLPGVHSGNEGGSGLYVRGGSPDQNLILLDDVPLYYVNHLGGFVSTFNIDAINAVELRKGGIPARYGGRLSSAIDIRLKEGNKKEFKGKGLIGIIASKVAIEGPIKKDTPSYIVSVRRLLYDLISRPLSKIVTDGISIGYSFHDINIKINHQINANNHLFFSTYLGQDRSVFQIKGENAIRNSVQWGNNLVAFRWNHLFNERLFSNTTIAYTRYRFLTKSESTLTNKNENIDSRNQFLSGIYDVSAKFELEYFISNDYKFRFGINSVHHEYRPGITTHRIKENGNSASNTQIGNANINAWEHATFLENEIRIGNKISANLGIRLVHFQVQNRDYTSFEPRGLVNLKINPHNTVKAAYTQIQQNIHLLTTSGVGLPIDLWVPPTPNIPPQRVKQWSLGWAKQSKSNRYEYSLEAYTKNFHNLISYKEGASFIGNTNDWENLVEGNGRGWAQGLEFLIEKKRGRTTGWLGYTLSKSERQFSNINQGKKFPFRYDKRHDISWLLTHQLNDRVYFQQHGSILPGFVTVYP